MSCDGGHSSEDGAINITDLDISDTNVPGGDCASSAAILCVESPQPGTTEIIEDMSVSAHGLDNAIAIGEGMVKITVAKYNGKDGFSSSSAPEPVTMNNCAKCTAALQGKTGESDDAEHIDGDLTIHMLITNVSFDVDGNIVHEHTVYAVLMILVVKSAVVPIDVIALMSVKVVMKIIIK